MVESEKLTVLYDYAAGRLGTRETIEALGMNDYADLLVALSVNDLPFPKPQDTELRREHRERAHAILAPLLRRHVA